MASLLKREDCRGRGGSLTVFLLRNPAPSAGLEVDFSEETSMKGVDGGSFCSGGFNRPARPEDTLEAAVWAAALAASEL